MASDWRHYLEGKDPAFPERTLTAVLTSICEDIQAMQDDGATADTRLAYYLIDMQPVPTGALLHLTTGGNLPVAVSGYSTPASATFTLNAGA
jgi:hypothetical protein